MTTSQHLGGVSGFPCSGCGAWHSEMPLSFHFPAPEAWSPDLAGLEDCELTSDACVIHGEYFFVRGLIRIPIVGHEQHFEWGVWASLSEENFWRLGEEWDKAGRETTPAMFGWLSTELPTYPEPTHNVRTMVHTQPVGFRPHIEVEPTEHPLAIEQQEGITWNALAARVELLMRQA
ncbi:DUF2199 domain-containing protein [Blastococcus sp. SYSU DS0617]